MDRSHSLLAFGSCRGRGFHPGIARAAPVRLDLPQGAGRFSNARLTRIVGEKSLKFGAIWAKPRPNCNQR
jgi:hypothetical protein